MLNNGISIEKLEEIFNFTSDDIKIKDYFPKEYEQFKEMFGKSEKWDNRGIILESMCDMTKPNAQKMSDEIHDSFITTVQETQEDNERLEEENRTLKHLSDFHIKENKQLKQQTLNNQAIVDKAIHLHISDTKGLALEYLNQLFWYYTGDKRKSESDQNWLIEYKNDIEEFRKILFKIVDERNTLHSKCSTESKS